MPLLMTDNLDEFPRGTKVRARRHGYNRLYLGEIVDIDSNAGTVTVDLYYSEEEFAETVCVEIEGDYMIIASIDMPWDDIPSPETFREEIKEMEKTEPCALEDVPLAIRLQILEGCSKDVANFIANLRWADPLGGEWVVCGPRPIFIGPFRTKQAAYAWGTEWARRGEVAVCPLRDVGAARLHKPADIAKIVLQAQQMMDGEDSDGDMLE
jgi:hypothetical protein